MKWHKFKLIGCCKQGYNIFASFMLQATSANYAKKTLIPALAAIFLMTGASPLWADEDDSLPDNPALLLPFAGADASRIRIEEAIHYRNPTDFSNHDTDQNYQKFRENCGEDEECTKHFADFDRTPAAHRAIDYVDVTGDVFTVYAGVAGKVDKITRIPSQPYFTSVAVRAKIRGRQYIITYTHLDPDTIQLRENDTVSYDTQIGQIYADQGIIWNLDGVDVKGYCRPDDNPHHFPEHSNKRCYPAHLDYRVAETIGDLVIAKDPYDICRIIDGGDYDSCKGYHYPGNRFGTPARPLGANHLWELAADDHSLKMAVSANSKQLQNHHSNPSEPQ